MTWRDAGAMALRELRRRPGRATLTVVAVALAAALLSAMIAISGTARTRVLGQLTHGGPLSGITVVAATPNPNELNLDDPTPGPPRALTSAAIARIRRLPGVSSVSPVLATAVTIVPLTPTPSGGGSFTTQLVGVGLGNVGALPVSLVVGRFPAPSSTTEVDVTGGYVTHMGYAKSQESAVLGKEIELAAFRLTTSSVTGAPFTVARWTTAEIVGVVDQAAAPGDVVALPKLVSADWSWTAGGYPSGIVGFPSTPYVGALVTATQPGDVAAVRGEIAAVGYSTDALQAIVLSVDRYLRVVELVLTGVGLIALSIAALGIANALFAAVRERRREIGVLKAIGARDRDVLRSFLVEAAIVGVVGGVLGTALGIAVAATIGAIANSYLTSTGIPGVQLSVPWLLPAGAVAGSALIALVAGTLPALRAARLPAREAVEA